MGILIWLVLGLVAGVLGKLLMPGSDPGGWIVTILLGIGGALLGGFIGSAVGLGGVDGFNIMSVLLATGGAMLLLVGYRLIKGRRAA